MIGTILGNVDVITLRLHVGTEMGSLDGSIGGSNYVNIEVLFLGYSMVYIDSKVLVSDEGIKLRISYGKVLGNILGNVDKITLCIDVVT